MDNLNNQQNQSYWFVVREDQSNVIFSNNHLAVPDHQITVQDTQYLHEAEERQYIQVEAPAPLSEDTQCKTKVVKDTIWDYDKIKLLLTPCLGKKNKISLKETVFWEEVAGNMGLSANVCKEKYRSLLRTYIKLLKKRKLGRHVKWQYFNICDEVFKDYTHLSTALELWTDAKIKKLLTLYIDNINRFQDPESLQKNIWKDIANILGTTDYNCYHKFKNLRRTYLNYREKSREVKKIIKWPYFDYFEKISQLRLPCIGPWTSTKTKALIEAYKNLAHKFSNPQLQKRELWKEIAANVGEGPSSCDQKFRNLKQTYIRLKMRNESRKSKIRWKYFKDFEHIYNTPCIGDERLQSYRNRNYVTELLLFYIKYQNKFNDPSVKKKNIWRMIASKLGLSPTQCDRKFRNLKQTYVRLKQKQGRSGIVNKWPYYNYFEQIYNKPIKHIKYNSHENKEVSADDIRQTLQNLHAKKDDDAFTRFISSLEDSNNIQRERNQILRALLEK